MLHLIKKDFLVQKRNLIVSMLIMLLFTFTFSDMGATGLTMSVLAITYMFTLGAFAMDDKNNCDRMLISLPLKKHTIVLSRYLSIFAYALYAIIINGIIFLILHVLNTPMKGLAMTKEGLLGAFCAIILFSSIAFPLLFKLGYHQAKMANFFLFFAAIFGGTLLVNTIVSNPTQMSNNVLTYFANSSDLLIMSLTLLPAFVIFLLSYFISLRFYKNREY